MTDDKKLYVTEDFSDVLRAQHDELNAAADELLSRSRPGGAHTSKPGMKARCACRAPATNQALYRRDDGSHFLGDPFCDEHRVPVGKLRYALGSEVVDHMEIVG